MMISSGVLRHSSLPVCLALAACGTGMGGAKVAAPASGYASGVAYEPAPPATYQPAHSSVAQAEPVPERPGLGTTYGEQVYAPISFAPFVRASSQPWAEVMLHYNDAAGINAHAEYLGT